MTPVVVFELNEVPWKVVDWWVGAHPKSAFAVLLASSQQYTSITPDEGHLSPWITWPTLHRGVPNTVHGIGHFGQDTGQADDVAPPWWVDATAAGRRVGLFGLLHTAELPADIERYAFWVPDTFAPTTDTHPRHLEAFQAFNLAMARASARNVDTSIDLATARSFVWRAPGLGLRPSTVGRLAKQLIDERRHSEARVRRRSYQSVLAFDLFMGQVRQTRPDAAAFFTNHVASAMHRYWAATFPDDYPPDEFGFDADWIERWNGELAEAMAHADRMIGRLVAHCRRTGSILLVASSMGQQAAQGTPVGRQLYLRDLDAFVADAGIDPAAVERRPAMDPHVNAMFSGDALDQLRRRLAELRIAGNEIEWHQTSEGFVSMSFGQADDAIGDITVAGEVRTPESLGLVVIEIEDEVASTGYHVPEGIVLVHDPVSTFPGDRRRPEISSTAIAPFVLELLDVAAPAHHRADPALIPALRSARDG